MFSSINKSHLLRPFLLLVSVCQLQREHTCFFEVRLFVALLLQSPDLAPTDFLLFGPLKGFLHRTKFSSKTEVKIAMNSVQRFLCSKNTKAFQCDKCVLNDGNCIEKANFFLRGNLSSYITLFIE